MENILNRAKCEISDNEVMYRRVAPQHFDNGRPTWAAFELSKNINKDPKGKEIPESYVSVNMKSKTKSPEKAMGSPKWIQEGYGLVEILASDIRDSNLAVIHAPSSDKSHSAICGFFTQDKYTELARKAIIVALTIPSQLHNSPNIITTPTETEN